MYQPTSIFFIEKKNLILLNYILFQAIIALQVHIPGHGKIKMDITKTRMSSQLSFPLKH